MLKNNKYRDLLVSINCITYNHEKYIQKTLDSFLMQRTNFPFEILIHDDASTDNTIEIIKEYEKKYPDIIKAIYREKNIYQSGTKFTFRFNIDRAKGKYIAICEGDDYWIDPLKLQKQVDFLENNPGYNTVVGRYKFLYQKNGELKENRELFKINNNSLSLKDYIAFNFSHTSTFLFRNEFEIPEWVDKVHSGDQALLIIATGNGKIKYMNDFFSVYRVNDGGVSASYKGRAKQSRKNIETFLNYVDTHTNGKYKDLIKFRKKLSDLYFHFESAKSPVLKKMIMTIIYIYRYYGVNFLAKKK